MAIEKIIVWSNFCSASIFINRDFTSECVYLDLYSFNDLILPLLKSSPKVIK